MATTVIAPRPTTFSLSPKAPKVDGPGNVHPEPPRKPLPEYLREEARNTVKEPFDGQKHINFQPPEKVYTMKDLGYEGQGVSNFGTCTPFQLFTNECVKQIRAEVFSDQVLDTSQYGSDFASNMIRNYAHQYAPFVYNFWNSPEVLSACSQVAGIELVPCHDADIGHVNVLCNEPGKENEAHENGKDVGFSWHYDSIPFVCVTMISDCMGMVGGETAIRTGSGEVIKARGPSMGTAVMMQSRYIEHAALRASGCRERITFITGLRPKDPLVRDHSVLVGSRPITNHNDMYYYWTEWRLEMLEARVRQALKDIRQKRKQNLPFDTNGARSWLEEQEELLAVARIEMI